MAAVNGTYRAGHVDLDVPVDWPEGSQVTVIATRASFGLDEGSWVDMPETRDMLAAGFETIEPLDLTPADEAEIAAARAAVRQASVEAIRARMDFQR